MYARAIDEAASRLRELRHEEAEDFGLAALVLTLALGATQIRPSLAIPLFLGGLALGALGVRALWRRWDLVDRLAGQRDAYVIAEVRAYASRSATMARRRSVAAAIRTALGQRTLDAAVATDLESLASELDDDELTLDADCAVACARLLDEVGESSLRDSALTEQDLRSRVSRIQSGFRSSRERLPS